MNEPISEREVKRLVDLAAEALYDLQIYLDLYSDERKIEVERAYETVDFLRGRLRK